MKSNHRMPKTSMTTILVAALLGLSIPTFAAETENHDTVLKKLDTNHDGFLDRVEALQLRHYENAFNQADENRDERLSQDEFVKAQSIHNRDQVAALANDSVITTKVKAALLKEMELQSLTISVETNYGEVLVSGFIDNDAQARRIRSIISAVNGVREVHDMLVVKG